MKKLFPFLVIALIVVGGLVLSTSQTKTPPVYTPTSVKLPFSSAQPMIRSALPNFDHIVILVMENKTFKEIIGNKSAPYTNSLATNNALAANYFAITHPSLPNYLSLISGDTFGISADCTACFLDKPNLVDNLEGAHKSWKGYMESMPKTCFIGSTGLYAQKHNPFIYFDKIRLNENRCQNIVPYTNLSSDLANPLSSPNFIFISPNLCHDMHDCTIQVGDDWLAQEVPLILNSPTFKTTNSLLIITWDESEGFDSNQVPTILIGAHVKQKFVSPNRYDHYSLLNTIESAWNLPALTKNDQNSPILSDFFN